ncbi:pantothenate kinase [Bryocella elongata]|uniref:Type III pantothenate kinase n=1 Tax=Bryocella elongata TaxID=863522 RepID=A0A1H6AI40_9BACT|nr:type III pantothenate kinase [Bryocella elongata]SEG48181.1 pantothenate kinase [Bryocella elongata]
MLLAINVGNTNTVLGLFHTGEPGKPAELAADWRVTTPYGQTSDELGLLFRTLLATRGYSAESVTGIAVASVVPPLDSALRQAAEALFRIRPLFIEPGIKTGLPILVDSPSEVGADRIVNCAAAFDKYGGPAIVVDIGTATNFDVVSRKGEFLGGAIAPGLGISADALFARAARLARVEIRKPPKIVGTNTTDNLQIGLYYGHIGAIDGILERMMTELGPDTKTVATGGFATLLAPDSKFIQNVDPMLTLTGLRLIYERNQDRHRRK